MEGAPAAQGEAIDEGTIAFYLEVPRSQIVMLQVIFESYEGVAVVRTLSPTRSLVSLLCPPSQRELVIQILHSIAHQIPWRMVTRAEAGDFERELGYFRKSKEETL